MIESRALGRNGGTSCLARQRWTPIVGQLDGFDGPIVTAGHFDVDPAHFGATGRHDPVKTEDRRTAFELAAARAALLRDLPLLGICAGVRPGRLEARG